MVICLNKAIIFAIALALIVGNGGLDDVDNRDTPTVDTPVIEQPIENDSFAKITKASNILTGQLLKDAEDDQVCVSGYSATQALIQLVPYMNGDTYSQVNTMLGLDKECADPAVSKALADSMDKVESANLMLIADTLEPKVEGSFVRRKLADESIVGYVNGFVNKGTHGMIPTLINEPFESDTRCVVMNTLYFKGTWVNQFDTAATYKDTFYGRDGETEIDFMHQTKFFVSYTDDILELKYKDTDIVMDIVKDVNINNIGKEYDNALKILEGGIAHGDRVAVTIPKFEIEGDLTFDTALKALGVKDLFDEKMCDLSGLCDEDLYVSKAIQKTKIVVDEEGTEAAAVSAMMVELTSAMPQMPKEFKVDHPFMYIIRNKSDNTVLFAGYIANF